MNNKRVAKDDFGIDGAFGMNIAPHFAAEFNYSSGSFRIHSMASQKLTAYTVDGVYKILPGSIVDPYLLVGGGEMDDTIGRGMPTNQSWTAEAGVGALTGIGPQTGSFRLQLRTEAKYRREFIQHTAYNPNNPGDVIFGVGLQFTFGAPVPPPPKVAAAPPPPEPTPPPPPPPPPPPLDSDNDGVPDTIDRCPNTPAGDRVDAYGCTIKDEIKLTGVNFATASAELVPDSAATLDYAVATLKRYPQMVIEVGGHTDSRGSAQMNLQLSQRRAETVMNYLKEHGVTNQLTAKGYGKTKPIADNKTKEGQLANRRVSLRIVGGP
ncbi:MAG: OmpA family protein [Steroidobacteraceae bacterium]